MNKFTQKEIHTDFGQRTTLQTLPTYVYVTFFASALFLNEFYHVSLIPLSEVNVKPSGDHTTERFQHPLGTLSVRSSSAV